MNQEMQAEKLELLSMMQDKHFDEANARKMLNSVPDVDMSITDEHGYQSTYMSEAVDANNIRMVKLLFEYGADPNYIGDGALCPLWDLQYWADDEKDDETRLAIVKLFLDHGANPMLSPEGEALYDWALSCNAENDWDNKRHDEYRWKFCEMLYEKMNLVNNDRKD